MQSLFAVIRSRGPAWDASRSMDGQDGWAAHAAFMNGLRDDGFPGPRTTSCRSLEYCPGDSVWAPSAPGPA
jgi:hypothetical protein